MAVEELQTEKLIKEKARCIFFKKGLIKATTQQIADEAGVNRALIHYYFRSREEMLNILLEEALTEKKSRVRKILSSQLPFREKIARYIDTVIDYNLAYPYLENFIISESNRNPERMREFCTRDPVRSSDLIREQLEEEIKARKLAPISAEHFLVNLLALCNYPLLAKPVLQTIHGMTDEAYEQFLRERKRLIFTSIFNDEMPTLL